MPKAHVAPTGHALGEWTRIKTMFWAGPCRAMDGGNGAAAKAAGQLNKTMNASLRALMVFSHRIYEFA